MNVALALIPLPTVLSWTVMMINGNVDWKKTRLSFLQPPNWVFAVAWSIIYLLYGLFAYLAVVNEEPSLVWIMVVWCMNLAANLLWTPVFTRERYTESAWLIVAMMGTLGALFVLTDNKWGRLCIVPYTTWLVVALLLNYTIAGALNKNAPSVFER